MGFRREAFATIWDVEPGKGNFTKVRLSVSRKNKDGEYEQDFSGFCTFIGTAHAKAAKLKKKDRIKLGDVDVSTVYDAEKNREYVNYKVFDFEMAGTTPGDQSGGSNRKAAANPVDSNEEEEAPF